MDIICIRKFNTEDVTEVCNVIARTLREVNIKDYPKEYIEKDVAFLNEEKILKRSKWQNIYIVSQNDNIIGCGAIGPYFNSLTESSLFTVFVLPEYQRMGIGSRIIKALENDEFFTRAQRIEIHASINACEFYLKMGYEYKNGITHVDDEGLYRLEKKRQV